jgi:hypothetical protein
MADNDKTGAWIFAVILGLIATAFLFCGSYPISVARPISNRPQGVCSFPVNGDTFTTHYQSWTVWHWVEVDITCIVNNVSVPSHATWPPEPRLFNTVTRDGIQTWICHAHGANLNPSYIDVPLDNNGKPVLKPGVRYDAQTEIMSFGGSITMIVIGVIFAIAMGYCILLGLDIVGN